MTRFNSHPSLSALPNRQHLAGERGFTLVEIAVAVAILGLALVTLVGLHTTMLNTYFEERHRFRASLYAQYLMTQIDTDPELPEPGVTESRLSNALDDAGYFSERSSRQEQDGLRDWTYRLRVASIALPFGAAGALDDALREIIVEISWGKGSDETFTLTYYRNTDAAKKLQQLNQLQGQEGQQGQLQN